LNLPGTDWLIEEKGKGMPSSKAMPPKNKREIIVTWQITCRQCKSNFEVEAPFGPREERALRCPHCGSKDVERVEASNQDAPQCGG